MTHAPNTREQHIHMARVYLHQARCTKHRAWRFTLMQWAADRRLKAAGIKPEAKQADLFGG